MAYSYIAIAMIEQYDLQNWIAAELGEVASIHFSSFRQMYGVDKT